MQKEELPKEWERSDTEKCYEQSLWQLYRSGSDPELDKYNKKLTKELDIKKEEVFLSLLSGLPELKTKSPEEYLAFLLGLRLGAFFVSKKIVKLMSMENISKELIHEAIKDFFMFIGDLSQPFQKYVKEDEINMDYMLDVDRQIAKLHVDSENELYIKLIKFFNVYVNIHLDRMLEDKIPPIVDGNLAFCFFYGFRIGFCAKLILKFMKENNIKTSDLYDKNNCPEKSDG